MIFRVIPITSMFFLAACSSSLVKQPEIKKNAAPIKYSRQSSSIVPVNSVASSNNQCVDNFNFLRQSQDDKYQKYSQDYIKVGDGYRFLSTNKNIMDSDAKRVYTMKLEIKLNTLCSEVNYAGYQHIQKKISELNDI